MRTIKIIYIFGLLSLLTACSNALYFYETEKISLTLEARPDSSQPIQGNIGIKQRIALITPEIGEKNGKVDGEALSSISSFRFKVAPDPAANGAFFNGFNPVLIRTAFITGKAASGLKQKQAEHAAKIVASFGENKTCNKKPEME